MRNGVKNLIDNLGDIVYIGTSASGSLTSSPSWSIQRITYDSGLITAIEWAEGTEAEVLIWDNRADYEYK